MSPDPLARCRCFRVLAVRRRDLQRLERCAQQTNPIPCSYVLLATLCLPPEHTPVCLGFMAQFLCCLSKVFQVPRVLESRATLGLSARQVCMVGIFMYVSMLLLFLLPLEMDCGCLRNQGCVRLSFLSHGSAVVVAVYYFSTVLRP